MKAIVSTQYGAPEVLQLQEVSTPTPTENEVLIRIHAASVTAADSMMRKGSPYIGRLFLGLRKPNNPIPGTGLAGKIEAVGKSVTRFRVGDEVFGESIATFGAYAEYVCLPEDGLITTKPAHMTYEQLAGICDGALTSLNLLREQANIQEGQKVLIIGASGSLGTAAVQLAKNFGTEVTGICSGKNVDMVKSLGADHVIDYSITDFTKNGQTYDIIYDTVGKSSFSKSKDSLTEKGIYLSPVLDFPNIFQLLKTSLFGSKKVKFDATGARPVPQLKGMLEELRVMLEAKKLTSIVDKRYSLAQVAEAHSYVDTGHKRGNVVLTPFHRN